MNDKECKNCGHMVTEDYCGKCGQSIKTGRIDWHYLLHEFQHSILHVDKGIFYTIKELLLRPDITIKNYLEGKRINYFKPFAFVIILGTIYGFIAHYIGYYPETGLSSYVNEEDVVAVSDNIRITSDWIHSHYSLTMLVFLPFAAFSSFWVFRKNALNYFEHLIVYAYITGMQIFILLVTYPALYILKSEIVYAITFVIPLVYNVWVIASLFKSGSWGITVAKSIISIMLAFFTLLFIAVCITVLHAVLVYRLGWI